MYVDCHCHLDHGMFDDIDAAIQRAKEAKLSAIITNGINPETNRKSLELAKKYDIVKVALGIYPPDALQRESEAGEYEVKCKPFDIDEEIDFIRSHKSDICAIGEVGLDYADKGKADVKGQKEVFEKMIELSEKLKKAIIVHSRKAESDVIDMLESSSNKKIVLHCFGGKFKLAKRAQENGWKFTIPTNVVRAQQLQNMVEKFPLSQIMTETDAPYLSPFGRFERNEPANIVEAVKKIAEIKKIEQNEAMQNIFMNYQRTFL